MKTEERRKELAAYLMAQEKAISGGELSKLFGVSRQIIVQDISVLKALGYEILSTHNGYVVQKTPYKKRVIKMHHTKEQTEDELKTIVALGGMVLDVFVWHKVYGKVEAKLNIFSGQHIEQFLEGVRSGKSSELMNITGGYHYHTIQAETEQMLDTIMNALEKKGYIAPEM